MIPESRLLTAPADRPLSTASRLAWPDAARGITVLLVVAVHVYYLQVSPMLGDAPANPVHRTLIDLLTPVRMPLFFVLSGFLSARMLSRSWRAGISGRIAPRAYLYIVWLVITALVLWLTAALDGVVFQFWDYVLPQLFVPESVLWYLWALAAYFALARATRAVPAGIAVAAAATVALVGGLAVTGPMEPIVTSFVWFLVGARLPQVVTALSEPSRPALTRSLLMTAAGLVLLRQLIEPNAILDLVASAASVTAVLALLPRVADARVLRPIRHIGRNTLPIFAMHPLLIIAGSAVLREWDWLRERMLSDWGYSLLAPVLEIVLIAMTAMLLHRLLHRIGLRHLFELPRGRRLRRRLRAGLERVRP
ncbi:acyltransferase family protein [Agrococcus sp. Ld7]|uniref:acyltransferase family protein n=1 Tax=Agrococcus sp. Ld7 TaxID=649148 RepID=UPI00386AABEB